MSEPAAGGVPEVDPLLVRTVTDLFRDTCSADAVRAHEGSWFTALWKALTQAGSTGIGVPEKAGGSGGTPADAAMVLRLAGRFAAPLPLAEHALLGGWLLAAEDRELPAAQAVSVAPGVGEDTFTVTRDGAGWRASGELQRVPWAAEAALVLALVDGPAGPLIVHLDPASTAITAGANLAGERRDTVAVDGLLAAADVQPAPPGVTRETLTARGALTRVLLSAGALDAVLDIATRHTQDRHQFGQPLNRFQAVAQRLALLGEQVARGQAAADLATAVLCAAHTSPTGTPMSLADVAVAKITAGEAASTAARHAHQVTGAIGVSQEFDLPLATRRLYSWRDEYGGENRWARQLGAQLAAAGPGALWDWMSDAPRHLVEPGPRRLGSIDGS